LGLANLKIPMKTILMEAIPERISK
jgi:hypothetical protein